jgi:hypothetical protein
LNLSLRVLSLALILAVSVPTIGSDVAAGSPDALVKPEECVPSLPSEEEAVARLRAIGVPEQVAPGPTVTAEPDLSGVSPAIPAGTIVEDVTLQNSLITTVRRSIACEYFDLLMTFVAFSSDAILKEYIPSIESFRQAVADRTGSGPYASLNHLTQPQSVLEVFGMRELEPHVFGLFVIRESKFGNTDDAITQHFADFYVISQDGGRFFLEEPISLGDTCQFRVSPPAINGEGTPIVPPAEWGDSCLEFQSR